MRRFVTVLVLATFFTTTWLTLPGIALYGPDPGWVPEEFTLVFAGQPPNEPLENFDALTFQRASGWDFGDREGYECVTLEYVENGAVTFTMTFERVLVPGQDSNYVEVNDKHGVENNDGANPIPGPGFDHCGLAAGVGDHNPRLHDGTDHFPHHTMLHFQRGGADFAMLDLTRDECANGYWTPGDEAGEVWLWWDADGPRNDGHHDLACGGGAEEPEAVLRGWVSQAVDGVSFCTMDSLDGDLCSDELPDDDVPPPTAAHESAVSLRLTGHLKASGDIDIPDGTFECGSGRAVVIERRTSGRWRGVGQDNSASAGHFSVHLPNRGGTYRARVLGSSLSNGDTCEEATSERVRYRRN